MKKEYMAPAAEFIRFETESILDASNPIMEDNNGNSGSTGTVGGGKDLEVNLW